MNKLPFTQKNDFVVKHKGLKHFSKDLELFQKHCPSNPLNNDLARANEFSFERLDGQMLYILLDKVSIEEILKNREKKPVEEFVSVETSPVQLIDLESQVQDNSAKKKLEELANRIDQLKENVEINEADINDLRDELNDKDASIEALETKIAELEARPVVKKKD